MNWKKYKLLPQNQKQDEADFVIGIDIGNDSSCIAYFDKARKQPEIIDISGGYGKPTMPTVIQYVTETKEWVFGEYALLNKGSGGDITLSSIVERLGKMEYIEIDEKPIAITSILGIFIKELIRSVKNINPNAEIVGIIVAIPSYLSEQAKAELAQAFKYAGLEKEVISLVTDRECIFARHYYGKEPIKEKVMLLDFGSRDLRGGVYEVSVNSEEQTVELHSLSSLFDNNISTKKINNLITSFLTECYLQELNTTLNKLQPQTKHQLEAFSYQHKDLLFQKGISSKPVRVYFNFAYPPFQKTVSKDDIDKVISNVREDFNGFLRNVLEKTISEDTGDKLKDIDTIIATGGGFEMFWAREALQEYFPKTSISFYKNSKGVIAEGASIISSSMLGLINYPKFSTIDQNQISVDIGIKTFYDKKERFVPLIERNSFWWQTPEQKTVLINEKTDKPVVINFFMRNAYGDVKLINSIQLDGLPERPKGTTKIGIALNFKSYFELTATFTDKGFGEMFPKTDFEKTYALTIS